MKGISKTVFYAVAGAVIYLVVHAAASFATLFFIVTIEPKTDPETVEYLIRVIGIVSGGSAAVVYTPKLYKKFCLKE